MPDGTCAAGTFSPYFSSLREASRDVMPSVKHSYLVGVSIYCHGRFKYKANGAQKPECTDKSGHDFDPDRSGPAK